MDDGCLMIDGGMMDDRAQTNSNSYTTTHESVCNLGQLRFSRFIGIGRVRFSIYD